MTGTAVPSRTVLGRAKAWSALCGAALALAACGTGTPPPSTTPTPTRSTSAAPTTASRAPLTPVPTASAVPTPPPTDPATVFGADGIGPYLIGAALSDLQTQMLVTGVTDSTACPGLTSATATGGYANEISLSFSGGKLVSIRTTSASLQTPSGTKVGTSLDQAQTAYGSRAEVITGPSGAKTLVVPVMATTTALALTLDQANSAIVAMSSGEVGRLESAARTGQAC